MGLVTPHGTPRAHRRYLLVGAAACESECAAWFCCVSLHSGRVCNAYGGLCEHVAVGLRPDPTHTSLVERLFGTLPASRKLTFPRGLYNT